MLKQLPTFLTVTLVAFLIWAFAETETLRSREVAVELFIEQDPAQERIATAAATGTASLRCVLTVEGTANSLAQLETIAARPLKIPATATTLTREPGEKIVDMREIVRDVVELQQRGVSIKKIEPASAVILIDDIVQREIRVRPDLGTLDLEGPAEARPSRVTLKLPSRQESLLPDDAVVIAAPDDILLARAVRGRRETVTAVRLRLPPSLTGSKFVRVAPQEVDVSFTLRSRTATTTIASVPVQIQVAPSEQPNWDIRIDLKDQFIADVTVTGPTETIRQLEENKLAVVALLTLSFTELESGKLLSKDVVFFCPADDLKFEAADKSVPFTATRRVTKP